MELNQENLQLITPPKLCKIAKPKSLHDPRVTNNCLGTFLDDQSRVKRLRKNSAMSFVEKN